MKKLNLKKPLGLQLLNKKMRKLNEIENRQNIVYDYQKEVFKLTVFTEI